MQTARAKLLLPCAFACAADVTMTLVGQPAAYWSGRRAAAEDFNPVVRKLLELHPAAFPLAAALGFMILAVAIQWLPRHLAILTAFAVTLAQTAAAAGWMIRLGLPGWLGAMVALMTAERLWRWATIDEFRQPSGAVARDV